MTDKATKKPTKKWQLERRSEIALCRFEDACREIDNDDLCMGFLFDDIDDELREEGLPPFASDEEAIQAIADRHEQEARATSIFLKHLKAAGRGARYGDLAEAIAAESKKGRSRRLRQPDH